jgi:endonuclease YncB( thermonuclease family)
MRLFAVLSAALIFPMAAHALAPPPWPGPYAITKPTVKDGDTVEVMFKEGPCGRGPCAGSIWGIRVRGIDAPEIHACRAGDKHGRGTSQSCARCPAELALGLKARDMAKTLIERATDARIGHVSRDAYAGRLVGEIDLSIDGSWQSLGDRLEVLGLAVPYDPSATGSFKKTKPWCGAP